MSVRVQYNMPELSDAIDSIALYIQHFDTYEDFGGWYNVKTIDTDEYKYIIDLYNKISAGTDTRTFTYTEKQEL